MNISGSLLFISNPIKKIIAFLLDIISLYYIVTLLKNSMHGNTSAACFIPLENTEDLIAWSSDEGEGLNIRA